MIKELTIPNLGLTMEKAKIVDWVKPEGGEVKADEVVLLIETDKLTYEITSPAKGVLHIVGQKGQDYPVSGVVGWIAGDKQEYQSRLEKEVIPLKGEAVPKAEPAVERKERPSGEKGTVEEKGKRRPWIASPLAKKIARRSGIDLASVQGTGPRGRITKADVIRMLDLGKGVVSFPPGTGSEPKETRDLKVVQERIPIAGRRAVILKHMRQSLQETAQMTHTMEVSASELVRLRKVMLDCYKDDGVRISYNALLIRILARVLRKFPKMNSSVEGEQWVLWDSVHVGLAMDAEDGLIVPVIRDADRKGFKELQEDIDRLIDRVKTKKLLPDDIKGGTFTLSSLGYLDIDAFTPILNPPEVGILGVGRIQEKPVVVQGEIRIGTCMMLSLTFDHRVIDGADAARFLKEIKRYVEEPYLLQA